MGETVRVRNGRCPAAAVAVAIVAMVATGSGATAAAGSTWTVGAPDPCADLATLAIAGGSCTHGGDPVTGGTVPAVRRTAGTVPPAPCPGNGVAGRRIRVFYGYPQGTKNRVETRRPTIRAAIALADQNLDEATSGVEGQHYRFYCARDRLVTVTAVKLLPIGADGTYTFQDVIRSLRRQRQLGLGRTNHSAPRFAYSVFVDHIACCYPYAGQASLRLDDEPDPSTNLNNSTEGGARYSMVRLGFPVHAEADYFQHEIGHNLGAVQLSAPHTSGAGHCYDGSDVMCYDDGGPYFQDGGALTDTCDPMPSGLPVWDCGADDYYDGGTPAPGSYLADHWNLKRSGWLAWSR
jgi:hypothetical protein